MEIVGIVWARRGAGELRGEEDVSAPLPRPPHAENSLGLGSEAQEQ